MIYGSEIISHLISKFDEDQIGKSSHWCKQLEKFKYDEIEGVSGALGFGTITRKNIFNNIFHFLMQIPYKYKIGKQFKFDEILKHAAHITKTQNRIVNLDVLRQVFTIAFIQNKLNDGFTTGNHLVIGDGFGNLSNLIILSGGKKVLSINLNEVLLVDYIYSSQIIPDESIVLVDNETDLIKAISEDDIKLIYISANNHHLIRSVEISTVFNIASMQEMDQNIIEQYFNDIRNSKNDELYFYCCNRITKNLLDGTTTLFFNYPWIDSDKIIVDELCPWHQTYYSIKPPFYFKYDGAVQHRLVNVKQKRVNDLQLV